MKKAILFVGLFCSLIYAQEFKTHFCGGLTLPIGGELGFLTETNLPNTKILKIMGRGTILWAPIFKSNKSILIGSLQPGIRLKLINEILLLNGGISLNPVAVLPFQGMDFGFGTFVGAGVNISNVELGLYWSTIFGHRIFISNVGWLSLLLSKKF
jgi:hypothetical protein